MAEQISTQLEAEYCPPIDPALLSAILSDFNLDTEQGIKDARSTLDPLKESALLEDHIEFDASGTGGAHLIDAGNARQTESLPDTSGGSFSRGTDITSLSNGLSSLNSEQLGDHVTDVSGTGDAEDLERLDEETKLELLKDIFGDRVSQYSIKHTLQKCKGTWNAAMEELLNQVYFEEAENSEDGGRLRTKGVDAFAENHTFKRGRKGKAKNRRIRDDQRSNSVPVSPSDAAPQRNKWDTAGQDIEFIVKRTGLSSNSVSSTYYQHGATLPKTIAALLKASIKQDASQDNSISAIVANARDLGLEFPTIAPEYLLALTRLTHPSTASAHELAKALTTPNRETQSGGIQIITNYQPPIGVETETLQRPGSKQSRLADAAFESSLTGDVDSAARARAYATARSIAFAQAQAAHRRAKSDRLMGGAAAYYGQVSRDFAALSFQANAAAADELAHAQSSTFELDLHGVDVLNAVRIAKSKVEAWWGSLGESRINGRLGAEDRQAGYCIVVGLGKHSEGGKSKIGPAVKKMLREDGWRFDDRGATILVRGRTKR